MDKQPDINVRREFGDIRNDAKEVIKIPNTNRSVNVGYLRGITMRKVSQIMNKEARGNDEDNSMHKGAAAIVLNGFWKIKFFYWILWRWYYYIREYDYTQLLPIVEAGKKKVPLQQYYAGMALLKGLDEYLAKMTRTEVEHTVQQLQSDKKG